MNWVLCKQKQKISQKLTKKSFRAFHNQSKNYWKVVHEPTTTSTIDAHALKWWKNQLIRVGWTNSQRLLRRTSDRWESFLRQHQKSLSQRLSQKFSLHNATFLFKLFIDKGISHIVKCRPPLVEPRSNNDRECIRWWEKFVKNQEWKKFVEEWTPSSTKNKLSQRLGGGYWTIWSECLCEATSRQKHRRFTRVKTRWGTLLISRKSKEKRDRRSVKKCVRLQVY